MIPEQQKELFVQLIREHEKLLFKVCHCYTATVDDCNDLYQEMVLQCWKAWPRFNHTAKVSTWLYRIALNTAITHKRKEGRRIPLSGVDTAELVHIPEADYGNNEQLRQLQQLISTLPALERALLLLYFEDRPHVEIAEIMGISVANVATRLARIRTRLKQQVR